MKNIERVWRESVDLVEGTMHSGIWLLDFPIPPSENALYRNVPRVGRVKTNEFRAWNREVEAWQWKNRKVSQQLKEYCELKPLLSVSMLLRMPPDKFWTQKNTVKRMDASNRLKASLDAIAGIMDLDDSYFWNVSIQKCPSTTSCLDIFVTVHTMWMD